VCVNAWFLLPDITLSSSTHISTVGNPLFVKTSDWFDNPANLFNPFRHTPAQSTTPALYTQLPVLVFVWMLTACVFTWRRRQVDRRWKGAVAAIAFTCALLLSLLMLNGPWTIVPEPLRFIQFTYRLESYVVFCLGLLVIVALRGLHVQMGPGERVGVLVPAFVAIAVFGGAVAVWQVWSTPSFLPDRHAAITSIHRVPATFYETGNFRDAQAPPVDVLAERVFRVPPESVHHDHVALDAALPPGGAPIELNVDASESLVEVHGVERLGRTAQGFLVVRRPPDHQTGPVTLEIAAHESTSVVVGRALTLAALSALLAIALYALLRSRVRRRGIRADGRS